MDIELEGPRGDIFHVHGRNAGLEGVALGVKPEGMIDIPVKQRWTQTAYGEGAQWAGNRFEPTDLTLLFHATDTASQDVAEVDAAFRRMWDYEQSTIIRVNSALSGTRELRTRLLETPTKADRLDMHHTRYTATTINARAADPFWKSRPDIDVLKATSATGSGTVTISNPTDVPLWLRWVAQSGARWTLPDWNLAGSGSKNITLPAAFTSFEVSIDSHPLHEQITIVGQPNAWSAMNGVVFEFPVPPWTPPTTLDVFWTGASGGPAVGVYMDRRWTRPWGME